MQRKLNKVTLDIGKQQQQQQQPSTQPTTKGNDRDLGKSGADDIQQHTAHRNTNEDNGMKQYPHATTTGADDATAMNQQQKRTSLDHMAPNDMQRTNQNTAMQQPTTDAIDRHEPNQVTGNNNTLGQQQQAAPTTQMNPSAQMNQPAVGGMNGYPIGQEQQQPMPATQSQQPTTTTTTAEENNAATKASQQQMQQPMSAGDGGTGGDTVTTSTAPNAEQYQEKNPITAGQGNANFIFNRYMLLDHILIWHWFYI